MTVTETVSTDWACDGPSCTETSNSPQGWLPTGVVNPLDQAQYDEFAGKHFHNETCLQNYLTQ